MMGFSGKHIPIFSDLVDGNVSLGKVFWLYGVIGLGVIKGLLSCLPRPTQQDMWVYHSLIMLALTYKATVLVGIWASTNKYMKEMEKNNKSKIWGLIASVIVIIGWLSLLVDMFVFFT